MLDLAGIRRAAGVTQVELATRMKTIQTRISQIERAKNLQLSTLVEYLEALGVEADLVIRGAGADPITQPLVPTDRNN